MKDKLNNRVMKFYKDIIYCPGMKKEFNEQDIKTLSKTLMFSRYELSIALSDFFNGISKLLNIKNVLNWLSRILNNKQ